MQTAYNERYKSIFLRFGVSLCTCSKIVILGLQEKNNSNGWI